MDISNQELQQTYTRKNRVYVLIAICVGIIFCYFLLSGPFNESAITIHVSSKEPLSAVSTKLKNKNVIRSTAILELFVMLFKNDKQILVGDYYFKQNSSVISIAWDLAHGIHNVNPIKITLREGLTNNQISDILAQNILDFNVVEFNKNVIDKQGYLFPDTYFFFPLSTTDEVISSLSNNFEKHIAPLHQEILASKHSLNDIISMAAILEHEANGEKDINLISGIAWKRLALGMPLQVDAAPTTYKVAGLPATPIANPGLLCIAASLHPTPSAYLYYLHDKNGIIHFATTFAEHKRNIARYLK